MNGERPANTKTDTRVVDKRAVTLCGIHTSTPKTMDGIHEQTYLQGLDNDSGYVSHNHESNIESAQPEKFASVYVSEDTLLEEPKVQNKPEAETESVYEEFTNVYYLNTILDSSGGTVGMNYSGLQDSSASSSGLNVSPELKLLQPIVTTRDKLCLFPPVSANSSSPAFLIDNDSNGENNPHALNNVSSHKPSTPKKVFLNRTPQKNCLKKTPQSNCLNKTPQKNCLNKTPQKNCLNKTPQKNFLIGTGRENSDKSLTPQKKFFKKPVVTPTKVFNNTSTKTPNSSNKILQNSNINNTLHNSNNTLQSYNNLLNSNNSFQNNLLNSTAFPNSNKILQNSTVFQNTNSILQNSTKVSVNVNSTKVLQTSNKINILNNSVPNKKASPVRKRKRSLSRTPQKQPIKSFSSDHSPDMFSDEDEIPAQPTVQKETPTPLCERYVLECDKCLVKRVGDALCGVLPPPSFTTFELSVGEMLEKIKQNEGYFWGGNVESTAEGRSLLVNTDLDGCLSKEWPEVLEQRFHGLHHNRSKLSEELESLCSKYSQRYVGSETQSSCTVFDVRMSSPSKRKSSRLRWAAKSPGRRLSHLARRRITFSSANLQAGGGSSSRQVMMDARRYELLTRKSPRKNKSPRKTPRKSPRKTVRTPKSSAKRRLLMDEAKAGPSSATLRASATKRALFQSPDKKLSLLKSKNIPSTSNPMTSPWKKKMTPKRALFCSPSKISPTNKRKRLDSDDLMPTKIARSLSVQSDSSSSSSTSNSLAGVTRLKTSRSESNLNSYHAVELSANHKKKLQWAVYEALRSQNIGVSHPQFKQFATILARVTRKLIPNPATTVKTEGTSERMLRIAKRHVFAATKGKTVEEIIQAFEAARSKASKPSGYVSKEAASAAMDVSVARSRDGVFHDKANTLNRESSNDVPAAKTSKQVIGRPENKIERVKKIINFDDDGGRYSFR